MKFVIERTSQTSADKSPPCEGCAIETITGRTPEGAPWIKDVWVRDFQTLEELVEFLDDQIVITKPELRFQECEDYPIIEIYDTWRE